MLKIGAALLAMTLCSSSALLAQGSGSMADPGSKNSSFRVSKSANGKVLEMKDGTKLVIDQKGKKLTLRVGDDTTIAAQDGADVAEPGHPTLGDVKPGRNLRVVYDPDTSDALEIEILREKS